MAPSAVEAAAPVVPEIKEKVLPGKAQTINPIANQPWEEVPELYTNHREPLKLSGALDHLEYFDVTPVIGREYVNVDLVELLRAPNSDDLLRDLAITSTSLPVRSQETLTNTQKSPNVA